MRAVILAAGQGRRLSPLTDETPKCLLTLGTTTFLQYQMDVLRSAGVREIGVVTGFCADQVRSVCDGQGACFHNDNYRTTNSLYSFALSGDFVHDGCLLLNSDVVFHPELIDLLLRFPSENALLADFSAELGEEEMKIVFDDDRRIQQLSKDIAPWDAHAENVGVLRLGPTAARRLLEESRAAEHAGERRLWAPQGIARLLDEIAFHAVDIEGRPWIEVDYRHDLDRAQEEVYPICAAALDRRRMA